MVANPADALQSVNRRLDHLVDATGRKRERTVDFLRALAIVVVVVWHWVLSVIHWDDGELVMPNAIADVPGGWLATWLLQVMPVVFFVGGSRTWRAGSRPGVAATA